MRPPWGTLKVPQQSRLPLPGSFRGPRLTVTSAQPGFLDRPRIVVADEDASVVKFVIDTLRKDGNAVFHAYDALSAVQLANSLDICHLVITNTQVEGLASVD